MLVTDVLSSCGPLAAHMTATRFVSLARCSKLMIPTSWFACPP